MTYVNDVICRRQGIVNKKFKSFFNCYKQFKLRWTKERLYLTETGYDMKTFHFKIYDEKELDEVDNSINPI